jgi:hypothetical protein
VVAPSAIWVPQTLQKAMGKLRFPDLFFTHAIKRDPKWRCGKVSEKNGGKQTKTNPVND